MPESSFSNVVNQAPPEAKAQGAVSQEPSAPSLAGENPDLAGNARSAVKGLNANSSLEDIQSAQKAVDDYGNSLPQNFKNQAVDEFSNILRTGKSEYESNADLVDLVNQKLNTVDKYQGLSQTPSQVPRPIDLPETDIPGVVKNDILTGNPLSTADQELGLLTKGGKGSAQAVSDVLDNMASQGADKADVLSNVASGNVAQLTENLGAKLSPVRQLTQASQGKVPGLAQITEQGDIAKQAVTTAGKLVPDADQIAGSAGNAVSQFGKIKNIASTVSKVAGDGGEIADDVGAGLLAAAPEFGPAGAIVAGISGLIGLGSTIAGLFHKNKPPPPPPDPSTITPAPTLSIGANLSTTN